MPGKKGEFHRRSYFTRDLHGNYVKDTSQRKKKKNPTIRKEPCGKKKIDEKY
jgi:hypothetical protein